MTVERCLACEADSVGLQRALPRKRGRSEPVDGVHTCPSLLLSSYSGDRAESLNCDFANTEFLSRSLDEHGRFVMAPRSAPRLGKRNSGPVSDRVGLAREAALHGFQLSPLTNH